jgi:hypothetical protein
VAVRRLCLLTVLTLGLALTACSSAGESTSSTSGASVPAASSGASPASAADTSSATDSSPASTAGSPETSAGSAAPTDSGTNTILDADGPDGAFCLLVGEFRTANAALADEFSSHDPALIEDAVQRMRTQVARLRDTAPDAVAADANALVDYFNRFGAVMEKYGYNVDEIDADDEAAAEFKALSTPASTLAFQHLTAYASNICKLRS